VPLVLLFLKLLKISKHPKFCVFVKLMNRARILTFGKFRIASNKVILMSLKTGVDTRTVL
jgi:hypothetical protein